MKLCIDCRWFRRMGANDLGLEYAECRHPSAVMPQQPNLVTGRPRGDAPHQFCDHHRKDNWSDDPCGPDGKYWEAAEPRGFA
jgi:hypothetical protein